MITVSALLFPPERNSIVFNHCQLLSLSSKIKFFIPTDGLESTTKGKNNKEIVKYIKVHKATRRIIRHGLVLLWFKDLMNEVTTSNTPDEKEPATYFAVIPHIQGVTEPIKRILNGPNVYGYQKPFQT